ncbi:MAG TPA: YdeI/OmpD-associated family protein [Dyella sp.]|uniref:YdeI/OmpD-associated family protein n=1 Tax=Dyella sp. TaxID=1869338 RepID=UPI002C65B5C8|nr:YdeI/OmpD-associated family protein [Dyella sp.]HTV83786.1 YdeI/OmpD-associated family protein [Dyella sp.]
MASRDPRVDAYIAKSADFARPILEHIRMVVHSACPEAEETIKWGFPHFDYRGAMMCSMAAFKQHCSFGFWQRKDVTGTQAEQGMGQFGKILSIKDLPGKRELTGYIRKAMALNDAGIKKPRPASAPKPPPILPADFAALLNKRAAARKTYEAFSPSAQREYIDWITEAKTDATRQRRMDTALEWLAEGKQRNWKYMK